MKKKVLMIFILAIIILGVTIALICNSNAVVQYVGSKNIFTSASIEWVQDITQETENGTVTYVSGATDQKGTASSEYNGSVKNILENIRNDVKGGLNRNYYALENLDNFWNVVCDQKGVTLLYDRYSYILDQYTIRDITPNATTDPSFHSSLYSADKTKPVDKNTITSADWYSTVMNEEEFGEFGGNNKGAIYLSKAPSITALKIATSYNKNGNSTLPYGSALRKDYSELSSHEVGYAPAYAYAASTAQERYSSNHESDAFQWYQWMINGNVQLDEANELYKEAKAFEKYRDEIEARMASKKDIMTIKADTEYTINVNLPKDYIEVGPFKVEYVQEIFNTSKNGAQEFASIMGAHLYLNKNGVETELNSGDWEFYFPKTHDEKQMGYKFPNSGEEFYVRIKKYTVDVNKDKDIKGLCKISFDYKTLNAEAAYAKVEGGTLAIDKYGLAESKKFNLNGNTRTAITSSNFVSHYEFFCEGGHYCSHGCCSPNCTAQGGICGKRLSKTTYCGAAHNANPCNCEYGPHYEKIEKLDGADMYRLKKLGTEEYDLQDMLIIQYTRRWYDYYKCEFEFEFKPETPDKPETKYFPLTMDIGGCVWQDEKLNKDASANGIFDNREKGLEKILVVLFRQIPNTQGYEKIKEAYTDSEGKYKFENLPIGEYYVDFTYDGLNYTTTKLLSDETTVNGTNTNANSSRAARIEAYIANLNASKYRNNSKADEDISDRQTFNNKFNVIKAGGANNSKAGDSNIEINYAGYGEDAGTKNPVKQLKVVTTDANGYVKDDFKMTASTLKTLGKAYPLTKKFRISTNGADYSRIEVKDYNDNYVPTYPHLLQINLGLMKRDMADFALEKEVYDAELIINGQKTRFEYNKAANIPIENFNISVRTDEGTYYYDNNYNLLTYRNSDGEELKAVIAGKDKMYFKEKIYQKVYPSDYNYRIDAYNGKVTASEDDELKVFITYKITLKNESEIVNGKILEFADYYDKSLTPREITIGGNTVALGDTNQSSYGHTGTAGNYNTLYVNSSNCTLMNNSIKPGEAVEAYIKFEVNKEADRSVILGDKFNVAEITAYSTIDDAGNATGQIDIDSIPGNATFTVENGEIKINNYEDDTDNAGIFNLSLFDTERVLDGFAWDDINFDGIRLNEETINNIKVELIEQKENGEVYSWAELRTGGDIAKINTKTGEIKTTGEKAGNGQYVLKGYIPGKYYIKFTYGVADEDNDGIIKYNGQDYKTTTCKCELLNNMLDIEKQSNNNYSDAKDDPTRRQEVINNFLKIGYKDGTLLSERRADSAEFISKTFMTAYTPYFEVDGVDLDLNSREVEVKKIENEKYVLVKYWTDKNAISDQYSISSLDMGLVKRPESVLELQKEIAAIKIIASDGTVLIDTEEGQLTNLNNWNNVKTAPISAYLDKEIMQGTTIQVKYKFKIINYSEKDNLANYDLAAQEVTTGATIVYDYVKSNYVFRLEDNDTNWEIATDLEVKNMEAAQAVREETGKYTIIKASNTSPLLKKLKAGEETPEVTLVLSKVISAESEADMLTYENEAEIIERTNTAGRRDAESIPGNHVPYTDKNIEKDTGMAQVLIILPPLGESSIHYVLIAIASVMLIGGIYAIKKYVL